MPTTNESLLEFAIAHAVGLQRYGTHVLQKVLEILNEADRDITAQLQRRLTDIQQRGYSLTSANEARLKELQRQIRAIIAVSYQQAYGVVSDELRELAKAEAGRATNEFDRALGVRLGAEVPSATVLTTMVTKDPFEGAVLKDWMRGLEQNKADQVIRAIRIGVTTGQTLPEVVSRISGTSANNFRDGILEIPRRHAEAVVRTAVNHISNRARDEVFKRNDWLVKAVKWVSTLDTRTTPICRARDGKVFPLESGPRPPAHFRCRSIIVAVTRSWSELGGTDLPDSKETLEERFRNRLRARGFSEDQIRREIFNARASMNGLVPADLTYGQWLRKQSVSLQNEVLGPTRARLFRDGKLEIEAFVDDNGRSYTLQELRRREREAFERAGLL